MFQKLVVVVVYSRFPHRKRTQQSIKKNFNVKLPNPIALAGVCVDLMILHKKDSTNKQTDLASTNINKRQGMSLGLLVKNDLHSITHSLFIRFVLALDGCLCYCLLSFVITRSFQQSLFFSLSLSRRNNNCLDFILLDAAGWNRKILHDTP